MAELRGGATRCPLVPLQCFGRIFGCGLDRPSADFRTFKGTASSPDGDTVSGTAGSSSDSQTIASSKLPNAATCHPRKALMKANIFARWCGSEA